MNTVLFEWYRFGKSRREAGAGDLVSQCWIEVQSSSGRGVLSMNGSGTSDWSTVRNSTCWTRVDLEKITGDRPSTWFLTVTFCTLHEPIEGLPTERDKNENWLRKRQWDRPLIAVETVVSRLRTTSRCFQDTGLLQCCLLRRFSISLPTQERSSVRTRHMSQWNGSTVNIGTVTVLHIQAASLINYRESCE